MTAKHVEPALYELLKGLASGNVFVMQAPQNVTAPFIIIQRTTSDRWRAVNGPSGIAQATIQIDVYDDSYYDAKDLAGQIETILDGYSGTVYHGTDSPQTEFVVIGGISLQNDFDILDQTEEPELYRITATYLVTFET